MSDTLEEYDINLVIKGIAIFLVSIILLFILCQPKVKVIETKCESKTIIVHDTVKIIDTVCPQVVYDPIPKDAPKDQVGGSGKFVIFSKKKNKDTGKSYKYTYYLTDSSTRGWSLVTNYDYDIDDTLDLKKR